MAGWDVTKPADLDERKDFPALHRTDKTTLRDQLGAEHNVLDAPGAGDGKHKFINQKVDTPGVRLIGTEVNAKDVRLIESAGFIKFQVNTGSEGTPVWVDILVIDLTTTPRRFRMVEQIRCDVDATSRLVLPVGTDKYAT